MGNIRKNKRSLDDQSLCRLQNKFRKSPFSFLVIQKITSANLCKPVHDIINYSTFICPFDSGKCEKEKENYKNLNISKVKRAF